MGFNNVGIEELMHNLSKQTYKGILGINIGKNATTPVENALDDYKTALTRVYSRAHYITVNISSPNTEGLRMLQHEAYLKPLLEGLKNQQAKLAQEHQRYVPLVIKLSPDLDNHQLELMAHQLLAFEIDGVIATNTTTSRQGAENSIYAHETGGLSGAPLSFRSTAVIQQLHQILGDKIPIIGSGGVMSAKDAKEKFAAGASLLQLYTGLIYAGPRLIQEICP